MTNSPNSAPPSASDSFEFELTDLASAREALDRNSLSIAAEASRPAETADWEHRRRPPVPTDRARAGVAIDWALRLPEALRPQHLMDQMPRLANQIALAWVDRERCLRALNALLRDDRGGRRGLPYEIKVEVEALARHLTELAPR
jgi:hypothetical protein